MKGADVLAESPPDIPDCVIPGGANVAKAVAAPAVPIAGDAADQVGLKLVLLLEFAAGLAVRAKLALPLADSVTVTVQPVMLVPAGPVRMMRSTPAVTLGKVPSSLAAMAVASAPGLLAVPVGGDDSMLESVLAQPPPMAMPLTLWFAAKVGLGGPMKIVVVALVAPAASGLWTMVGVATDADPKG